MKLGEDMFVTIANPKGNPKVSLIFMRLPDGSPSGQGYNVSQSESLERLELKQRPLIHSVDKQSKYSNEQLAVALARA